MKRVTPGRTKTVKFFITVDLLCLIQAIFLDHHVEILASDPSSSAARLIFQFWEIRVRCKKKGPARFGIEPVHARGKPSLRLGRLSAASVPRGPVRLGLSRGAAMMLAQERVEVGGHHRPQTQ